MGRQQSGNFRWQSGVSLIEVLITVLVISIGLLGLAALNLESIRANTDAMKRSQVVWLVESLTEQIHANAQGAYNYLSAPTPPLPPFADGNGQPCAAQPSSHCSATAGLSGSELSECTAFRDALWRAACGTSLGASAAGIVGLPGGQLTLTCRGACQVGDTIQIQAQWNTQFTVENPGSGSLGPSTVTQEIVP